MEESEVLEVFEYLTEKKRPIRLRGKAQKNAFKAWKKKVNKLSIEAKDEKLPLSVENSVFFTVRSGNIKIFIRKSQLEELWERFHKAEKTGGHQGLWSMLNRIKRGYFVKDLRSWLEEKLKSCPTCKVVEKRQEVPPSACLVPERALDAWQMDYIGRFPVDSKQNSQYALVAIDCFSKYTMVSSVYEQGDEHVWSSLEDWFRLNGKPKYIFSDNGGPFISDCKLKVRYL